MPFVNELIPEDKYDFVDNAGFLEIHGQPYKLYDRKRSRWTIDHDRNYILIAMNSGGGSSFGAPLEVAFGLWMDGEVINFRAEEHFYKDANGHHLLWKNTRIFTKAEQRKSLDEIKRTISEALYASEQAFGNGSAKSVNVEFYKGGK